jgi:hypothetical protein
MQDNEKTEELTESLKKYVSTNYSLIKLEVTERTSVIGSFLISRFILTLVAIFFIFFLSMAAGLYLSHELGDLYSGFIIVAGFYFLLFLILIMAGKSLVEKPLQNKIIRKILSK